jgi:hypothetical protein
MGDDMEDVGGHTAEDGLGNRDRSNRGFIFYCGCLNSCVHQNDHNQTRSAADYHVTCSVLRIRLLMTVEVQSSVANDGDVRS